MIDPVCLAHGQRQSEHLCIICCLCFETLTLDDCNVRPDGHKEDVCVRCAKQERAFAQRVEGALTGEVH